MRRCSAKPDGVVDKILLLILVLSSCGSIGVDLTHEKGQAHAAANMVPDKQGREIDSAARAVQEQCRRLRVLEVRRIEILAQKHLDAEGTGLEALAIGKEPSR